MVEAAVAGRASIGTDVDPIATFVSKAKTQHYSLEVLEAASEDLLEELRGQARTAENYASLMFDDLDSSELSDAPESLKQNIPKIPNLHHWFRTYVIIDLAQIRQSLLEIDIDSNHRLFFDLCFASIIRNASNADPVPVSGLEVTAHIKRLDKKGRLINPFALFEAAVKNSLKAVRSFVAQVPNQTRTAVEQADATRLSDSIDSKIDVIITSPPYSNAVDYYRRHQLEMFWLGLTRDQDARLALLKDYIGRPKVPKSHPFVRRENLDAGLKEDLEARIRERSPARANSFKHYCVAMTKSFKEFSKLLDTGKKAVLVVGESQWRAKPLPMVEILKEIASPDFILDDHMWYPVKNRYMSYARRNGANINREHVLAFRRK